MPKLFGNKETNQNDLIKFANLSPKEAKKLRENPNKWIDKNFRDCCGETRALLNGEADKAFWWAVIWVPIFGIVVFTILVLTGKSH
jgi:hypothetical protein